MIQKSNGPTHKCLHTIVYDRYHRNVSSNIETLLFLDTRFILVQRIQIFFCETCRCYVSTSIIIYSVNAIILFKIQLV